MAIEIPGLNPLLSWVSQLLSLYQTEAIIIPEKYRDRVLCVKKLFNDDPSGLVTSLMDFAIECALVTYRIEVESDSDGLENILNNWLSRVNIELLGKAPTGIRALAKENFRERWKGSSNLLLRTFWNNQDGLILPTSMFFVEGEDIKIKSNSKDGAIRLDDAKYYLRINNREEDDIPLPLERNEEIFVQRPFESWGCLIPTPYLVKKGVYRHAEFLRLLSSKGENIVAKAIEYLFILKKGTEGLYINANHTYDKDDFDKINEELRKLATRKNSEAGFPSLATNFDTDISEYIPEYGRILNEGLRSSSQKEILAGLGFIEVIEGIGSTRRESILNPKPFIAEVYNGINDFKSLLNDIIFKIIEKNRQAHPKWMNAKIRVMSTPIPHFIDDKFRTMLRSAYDRGTLSKRTFVEIGLDLDFDLEVERRVKEKEAGLEEMMYPPVIQNQEAQEYTNVQKTQKQPIDKNRQVDDKKIPDKVLDDRKGPESKNFNQSWEEAKVSEDSLFGLVCKKCGYEGDLIEYLENLKESETLGKMVSICPGCEEELSENDVEFAKFIFEEAPYKTNKDLPSQLKNLPSGAKSIFRETFNRVFQETKDENAARQAAWRNVKLKYHKVDDQWKRKIN